MKSTNRSRLMYMVIFASLGLIFCVLLAGAFSYLGREPRAQLQPTSTYTPFPTNTQVSIQMESPSPTSTEVLVGGSSKTVNIHINIYAEQSKLPIKGAIIAIDGVEYIQTEQDGVVYFSWDIPTEQRSLTLTVKADGFSPVTQLIETPSNKDIDYEADIYLPDEGIIPPPPPASETPTFASITALPTTSSTPFILETPNATQTIAAAFEEANRQFENLPSSSIAFNKPEKIKRNETTTIELILNPSISEDAIATQLIEQSDFVTSTSQPSLLLDSSGASVSVETSSIEITPLMSAELASKSPDAFTIKALHSDPVQVVGLANTTTWHWEVTALKEGPQTLYLTISQLVKYNGKEEWHVVQIYNANIVVEVTPLERVKSLDWKWIFSSALALVGSILGVLGYLNNRKKKAEEEKPAESPKKKKKQL
jgi:hypothetical protein